MNLFGLHFFGFKISLGGRGRNGKKTKNDFRGNQKDR